MARQPRLDEPLIGSPSKTKSLSQLLFLGVSVVAILCFSLRLSFHGNSSDLLLMPVSPQVCATTLHPDSCSNTFVSAGTTPVTAATILGRILEESIQSLPRHVGTVIALTHKGNNGKREAGPLADCLDLMDQTESRLVDSLNAVAGHPTAQGTHADVHTWLSAALTNYVTCLDGLDGTDAELAMESEVKSSMALLSTSLAVLNQTRPTAEPILGEVLGEFSAWLSPGDRKLLTVDSWDKAVKADVVVAQDGSGKYTTVTAAVNAALVGSGPASSGPDPARHLSDGQKKKRGTRCAPSLSIPLTSLSLSPSRVPFLGKEKGEVWSLVLSLGGCIARGEKEKKKGEKEKRKRRLRAFG